MARGNTSLEDKARWMREQHYAPAVVALPALQSPVVSSAFSERHFSVAEVADLWNLSQDFVRRIFQKEPGVLVFSGQVSGRTRRYTTLRIPESVVQRVHRRLANVARHP